MKALHIDFYVENKERFTGKEVVFMTSNHYSTFDPLMLIAISETPVAFVGKHEVRNYPLIGRIFRILNGQFIDRDNLKQELRVVRNVQKSLANKEETWVIYPEGTRNKSDIAPMREFKAGTFKIPLETKTTIIPLATFGSARPMKGRMHWRRYPVQIRFLEPITAEQFKDLKTFDIAKKVYDVMQSNINELRQRDAEYVKEIFAKKGKKKVE
ncbi:MAG: lysophospholipid acyltransferase family protein [Firmicutes bacterium]|nr:lysophospholipid acyltransferase family protein [Bacillota bacterium]